MATDLHKTQASILRELLFKNGTNFASLNKFNLANDLFTFHLKKLMNEDLIEKRDNKYYLTQQGKMLAGNLNTDNLQIEKWGKATVTVTAIKKENGKTYVLMQQRLKEPFFGYYGFINGKIRFGDMTKDTALRELKEETGLTGKPKLVGVFHKLRGPHKNEVKLDNFFYLYLIKDPKGTLINTIEGKNSWFTLSEAKKLKTFPGFSDYWPNILGKRSFSYIEKFHQVEEI